MTTPPAALLAEVVHGTTSAFVLHLGGRPYYARPKGDGQPGYSLVPALHPAMVQAMAPMMTPGAPEEQGEA